MKKMTTISLTQSNKRSLAARCVSAIVCFALLLLGATAFAAAPSNDNFANAAVFTGTSATGSNVDATRESGDPTTVTFAGNPPSQVGNSSVWWKWTPDTSETVSFATGPDSTFDTQLGVYTGTLGNLTEIASDEDSTDFAGGMSKVTFNANAGTTYYIMVNGFESATGTVNLHLTTGGTPPPPTTNGVALTVTTTGGGTVTRNPDKTSYDTNEVVTLTANPTGTNTFVTWGGDAAAFGSTNPITLTLDASKTVTAEFTGTAGGGGGGGENGKTSMEVIINGIGKVRPNLSGKDNLRIGHRYSLTASPGKDQVFAGWTGFTNSSDRKLTFIMEPGLTAIASFVPNPFNVVEGTFNGLFFETNVLSQDCSGYFTAKISKTGKLTIKLNRGGKSESGSGELAPDGSATITLGKKNSTNQTVVQLQADMTGESDKITGTVTTPDCVAELSGDRVIFSNKNPTPLEGKYNLTFARNEVVDGTGFATLSINKSGKATLRGELADGSKISQSTSVSRDGQVPVYVPLYKKDGSLIGWLNVTGTNAFGTFSWIKPGTNGFAIELPGTGSAFDSKAKPTILLPNAVVELGGDGIVEPLLIPVNVDEKSKVTVVGTNSNNLSLKISSNGQITGTFDNPATAKKTRLRGIILQDSNTGLGYFVEQNNTGFFELRDATVVNDGTGGDVEPPVDTNPTEVPAQ